MKEIENSNLNFSFFFFLYITLPQTGHHEHKLYCLYFWYFDYISCHVFHIRTLLTIDKKKLVPARYKMSALNKFLKY